VEGNECYKFSTIQNYVAVTGAPPVRLALDIGANVGAITRMLKAYFPDARVYGYEAVADYVALAAANTRDLPGVTIAHRAISAAHKFRDDVARRRRTDHVALRVLKGTPDAGPGWAGGSIVVAADDAAIATGTAPRGYQLLAEPVPAATLDEVVSEVLAAEGGQEIDIVKMDCEGCEHSCLGSAGLKTLRRCRFIVGEYHDIQRFYTVMQGSLYRTHKVSLIGQHDLGAFFAERLDGTADGILRYDKTGMLLSRPWLGERPIDWHVFAESYVRPEDRFWHALA
jgi:FkbM family methyltransferase